MKNNSNISMENWLKVSDVAVNLNVSKTFVYKIIGSGELKSLRMGKAIRVRRGDLDSYILNCLSPSNFVD